VEFCILGLPLGVDQAGRRAVLVASLPVWQEEFSRAGGVDLAVVPFLRRACVRLGVEVPPWVPALREGYVVAAGRPEVCRPVEPQPRRAASPGAVN